MAAKIRRINRNFVKGKLAKGCRLCMIGAKLVLFVTGKCSRSCFYCPLSEVRRGKDKVWANERLVNSIDDVIDEAERMQALGCGITGGDPATNLRRTKSFIRILKREFGEEFHIHMYTATFLNKKELEELYESGLDEIRFHVNIDENLFKSIEHAKEVGLSSGAEIPSIPNKEEEIISIAERLKEIGADFLNINELEVSETNYERIKNLGYDVDGYIVVGSLETALKAMRKVNFNIHLCTASYKDGVQLRNRLIRTAINVAKDYEYVNEDGLLVKGVIYAKGDNIEYLKKLREILIKRFGIDKKMIVVDEEKRRIETSVDIAETISRTFRRKNLEFYIVEEYPTKDRLETEQIPL